MLNFYHFGEIHKEKIPEANINKGKFVQLKHFELGDYMIMAPKELCTFHAEIVNLFCHTIQPNWSFSLNSKSDHGVLNEEQAVIIGGGFYEILDAQKRLNLSGASLAFGDYEAYGFEQKIQALDRFKDFTIFC